MDTCELCVCIHTSVCLCKLNEKQQCHKRQEGGVRITLLKDTHISHEVL